MIEFDATKRRIRGRFNEINIYLAYMLRIEPVPPAVVPPHINIMKGLFYVQLYAAFERSINDSTRTCLSVIDGSNVKNKDYSAPIVAIALLDRLKSLRDSAHHKLPRKGSQLFLDASSSDSIGINEDLFASQLQNAWMETIHEVFFCLGCSELVVAPEGGTTVDEIVERRNAVAHGRESALEVGERFRVPDLQRKSQTVREVLVEVVEQMETYCEDMKYVKPRYRRYYP